MNIQQLKCYTEAQNIARRTMEDLEQYVAPGSRPDHLPVSDFPTLAVINSISGPIR